jgi:hypothetical protein
MSPKSQFGVNTLNNKNTYNLTEQLKNKNNCQDNNAIEENF